ncbi:hypothetical protein JCM10908_000460 [Rhodotorula pacifica]|uniref:uncharacterized protein n=1 Tax=Rhodotorula pacifica TaxID=1495444 RepID=UPI00316ECB37
MGLAYFAAACPAQPPTLQAAAICLRRGKCCGICGNTLATLGSRVGLSVTVLFSTAVTVVDGAESPFNFMTACVQAVAYLIAILISGFGSSRISKFHAYHALVAALGFLCPLAASAVTAPHYNYGGSHGETGKRLKHYGVDIRPKGHTQSLGRTSNHHPTALIERSLGPFSPSDADYAHVRRFRTRQREARGKQDERRPLTSTRVWDPLHGASSVENSPVLLPEQEKSLANRDLEGGTESRRSPLSETSNRIALRLPSRATPSAFLHDDDDSLVGIQDRLSTAGSEESESPRSRSKSRSKTEEPLLESLHLPSPAIPMHKRLSSPHIASSRQSNDSADSAPDAVGSADLAENRRVSIGSNGTAYSERTRERIARKVEKGAWRRYGMISANAALFSAWLITFLLVHGVSGGTYELGQTKCEDPSGTTILFAAQIVGIALSLLVGFVCWANFYSHYLHYQLRRIFDYSRGGPIWTRALVPAIFSGVIYCTWLVLLWTAYELSATPDSSLLFETEESLTFASTLAMALAVRPVCDLLKALWKYARRSRRDRKRAAERAAAEKVENSTSVAPGQHSNAAGPAGFSSGVDVRDYAHNRRHFSRPEKDYERLTHERHDTGESAGAPLQHGSSKHELHQVRHSTSAFRSLYGSPLPASSTSRPYKSPHRRATDESEFSTASSSRRSRTS